jgi:hypothetical protein
MIYYAIYVKNLHNGTGYIDVALTDDQLLKDFRQYLDCNVKPDRSYVITAPPGAQGKPVESTGTFVINVAEVTAISIMKPDSVPVTLPPSEALPGH